MKELRGLISDCCGAVTYWEGNKIHCNNCKQECDCLDKSQPKQKKRIKKTDDKLGFTD